MRKSLFVAGFSSFIFIIIFLIAGISNSDKFKEYGPWGDLFGGVVNPILTFFTFICVLATLYLQNEELGLSRRELARSAKALETQNENMAEQKKQNIFFQMLSLHNQIIDSIDLHTAAEKVQIARGRDCFSIFYTKLSDFYKREVVKGLYSDQECIERAYGIFWNKYQLELGHYYRFLYRMMVFTDKEFSGDDYYMGILRAQISDQELLLLFYNSLTVQGANFQPLIEKWAIFDNLPVIRLLSHGDAHKVLFSDAAYSSTAASRLRVKNEK